MRGVFIDYLYLWYKVSAGETCNGKDCGLFVEHRLCICSQGRQEGSERKTG